MKSFQGINLLDFRFIAYTNWLMSHSDALPKLAVAGKALISETSTVKQRVIASRDIHDILLTIIEDAPDQIFGDGEDVSQKVFTDLAEEGEKHGLNVLLLIKIVGIVLSFMKK